MVTLGTCILHHPPFFRYPSPVKQPSYFMFPLPACFFHFVRFFIYFIQGRGPATFIFCAFQHKAQTESKKRGMGVSQHSGISAKVQMRNDHPLLPPQPSIPFLRKQLTQSIWTCRGIALKLVSASEFCFGFNQNILFCHG